MSFHSVCTSLPLNNSEQEPYTHGGLLDRLVDGVLGSEALLQQGQVEVDEAESFHLHGLSNKRSHSTLEEAETQCQQDTSLVWQASVI